MVARPTYKNTESIFPKPENFTCFFQENKALTRDLN